MRISDWSSDVCSSDLGDGLRQGGVPVRRNPAPGHVREDQVLPGSILHQAPVAQGGCVAGQVLEAWRRFTTARCLTVVHIPDSFHSYMAACVIAVNIGDARKRAGDEDKKVRPRGTGRSDEHTSELQSLMRHSYADCC